MYDLVLKGGRVYDGSGMPSFYADLAVKDGRIAAIGRISAPAQRTLDVSGLAVSPGFIDNHTHFDAQLLWDPLATSSCFHGITTVITGNCGLSLAPCREDTHEALVSTFTRVEAISRRVLEEGVEWRWESTAQYLDNLRGRLGLNVGALIGHCAVRHAVMGEDAVEREATDDEIEAMRRLVHDGMEAGAVGFSTNNNPRHMREDGKPVASSFASSKELNALTGVLAEMNVGVIQNIQGFSPAKDVRGRVKFVADFAKATGRPIVWQGIVHRWHEGDNWKEALQATEQAFREDGVSIYPVTQAKPIEKRFNLMNAQVFDEFPTWRTIMLAPVEHRKAVFADPEVRRKLSWEAVEDPSPSHFGKRWDLLWVQHAALEKNKVFEGQSVQEIATQQRKGVLDTFLDLALEENLETGFHRYSTQGDPEAVAEILRSPYVLVGQSDAGAHMAFDAAFGFSTTFLGKWVRDKSLMDLEAGVRKLTFDPASIFGLGDRGLLRPGFAADIAVFDAALVDSAEPEWAEDLPGGEKRLIQRAIGVHYTIVNGQVLVENGQTTEALPGRVLRPGLVPN